MSRALRIAAFVLPLAVVAAIWLPFVEHYYVPSVRIAEASLADFLDRPSDAMLATLGEQFLGFKVTEPTGLPPESSEEQLRRFGLFQVAIDLDEFERSGDAQQFAAIERSVVDFAKSANGRFVYDEFLWNDHAIANRMFVLAKFWGHYRRDPSFEASDARAILEHVAKNAEFLMHRGHFTYWTNHGVMQSIALLHAANAFPALPERDRMVRVALDRLDKQLRFFVSDSGWVMEHSAEYQEFGANLLSTLMTELEVLGREAPAEWQSKLRESTRVLEWLTRPDGSIPNFGDSGLAVRDKAVAPSACDAISPAARYWPEGYFVAWDVAAGSAKPSCAQTVVVWSDFVSNAHKRPHAMSVHYWADGVDYAMGAGYWPYDDADRLEATGWRGSNAPHFGGETGDAYTVETKGFCAAGDFRFLDLQRDNDGGNGSLRRQVVDLGVGGLLLVDSSDGDAAERETVWRIDERTTLLGPDGRVLYPGSAPGDPALVIEVSGASVSVETLAAVYARDARPSPDKFSIVAARGAIPTYVVTSAAADPSLTALGARPRGESYRLRSFETPERWRVEDRAGRLVIERSGQTITRSEESTDSSRCDAAPPNADEEALRRMESSFAELEQQYPIFKPWVYFRLKATIAVLALLTAQALVFWLLSRASSRALRVYAAAGCVLGWLALGAYITLIYLAQ